MAAIQQIADRLDGKPSQAIERCDAAVEVLAERVGFEPTVRFPAHTLSKRAP
jgi:hypothetical protein